MVQDKHEGGGSGWVFDKLDWNHVQNVKVRIAGSSDWVPTEINGIRLMPKTRQFIAWWFEARGDAPMPAQIDLRALVELLPYTRVLRWEGEDSLIISLLGTAIVEVIGADYTGVDVFGDKTLQGYAEELERYKLLHDHPCGLLLRRGLPRRDGTMGTVEVLSMPVSFNAEGKARVVGTVTVCEPWQDPQVAIMKMEPISPVPKFLRAAFIDIGFGLPAAAARLTGQKTAAT
jgi:hypothetical protein